MPVARGKITIFFDAEARTVGSGWTETWYSPAVDYSVLLSQAMDYVKVRKELLGIGATIIAVRVSDDTVFRDALTRAVQGKDGFGNTYVNAGPDDHDPVQVSLLCRIEAGPLYRRSLMLSGLPDSVTDQLVTQGVFQVFLNTPQFKQWVKKITDLKWQIRTQIKPHTIPPSFTVQTIDGIFPVMVRNRKRGRRFFQFVGAR
jgi:hypothetical protein